MRSLAYLALLSTLLAITQGAFGAEPAVTPAAAPAPAAKPAATESAPTAAAVAPPASDDAGPADAAAAERSKEEAVAPPEPAAPTAYERAIGSLANRSGLSFESELTADGGQVQRAVAIAQGSIYSVSVRTLPQPDTDNDGSWLVQNGKFLKRTDGGMSASDEPPASVALVLDAMPLLPDTEGGLDSARPAAIDFAGGTCQPRKVKLSAPASERFSELGVCVDEASAHIVKLDARTPSGASVSATLTQLDTSAPRPKSNGRDWTSEFPIAKPEDRRQKLKYEDCPELINLLPKGCKDFVPEPSEDAKAAEGGKD